MAQVSFLTSEDSLHLLLQNLPKGVMNIYSSQELLSRGICQNPLFASSLEETVAPASLCMHSRDYKWWPVCMLARIAVFVAQWLEEVKTRYQSPRQKVNSQNIVSRSLLEVTLFLYLFIYIIYIMYEKKIFFCLVCIFFFKHNHIPSRKKTISAIWRCSSLVTMVRGRQKCPQVTTKWRPKCMLARIAGFVPQWLEEVSWHSQCHDCGGFLGIW